MTLNSDDPGMFDTTLCAEYRLAHERFGVSYRALADLARTAVDVSFAPQDVKRRVRREIDDYVAANPVDGSQGRPAGHPAG